MPNSEKKSGFLATFFHALFFMTMFESDVCILCLNQLKMAACGLVSLMNEMC